MTTKLKEKFNLVTPFTLYYGLIKATLTKRKITMNKRADTKSYVNLLLLDMVFVDPVNISILIRFKCYVEGKVSVTVQ